MDKEYRSPIYGGIDQPGDKDGEAPKGSRVADRFTIGEFARELGVTLRALRFYQSKGLLAPQRDGSARVFSHEDRNCLALICKASAWGSP